MRLVYVPVISVSQKLKLQTALNTVMSEDISNMVV